MTPAFQLALQLYQHDRYQQAAAEFRRHLTSEPNDAMAHAFLGLCLSELKDYDEATTSAQQAIVCDPEDSFGYYALGRIYLERNRAAEARQALREAIRLAPDQANCYATLGAVEMSERRWKEALQTANDGLQFDGENAGCLNVRTTSLTQLGRHAEAEATIRDALANSPEDSYTHANQGWAELHKGNPQQAMIHFSEALRLDPENEFAREGIVRAMKARNLLYRWILAFFLWMSRLPRQWQWGVLIALIFAPNVLRSVSRTYPSLAIFIDPIQVLILFFAVMTWIADPLFNMVLRFDRFGKHALSQDQIRGANLLAAFIIPAYVFLMIGLLAPKPHSPFAIMSAWTFGVLVLPASQLYLCDKGWPRNTMAAYLITLSSLAAICLLGIVTMHLIGLGVVEPPPRVVMTIMLTLLIYPWLKLSTLPSWILANWLTSAKVRL